MPLHAHYKRVPHSLCSGTGWLTTKGSKNQIRCKCENGYILQKQDDLIDVLFDIARTANDGLANAYDPMKNADQLANIDPDELLKRQGPGRLNVHASDAPIKPDGWEIGKPPKVEEQ